MQEIDAELWASSRLQQLQSELLELRCCRPHERRSRLRSLQLELHPDKQPLDRREKAQSLFLQVQKEWENDESAQRTISKKSTDRKADRRSMEQEAMATVRKRQLDLQRRLEENRRRAEAEDLAKRQTETVDRESKAEVESRVSSLRPVGREKKYEDGRPNIDELSTHCQSIANLLNTGSLSDMLQAFEMIEASRQNTSLSKMDRASLDWFESECWRRYASHQAKNGQLVDAIDRCLEEAIKLSPKWGELYLDRARWLSLLACPHLRSEGGFLSQAEIHGAHQVLADIDKALDLDESLADAYDLGVQLLIALGDLASAEKLAKRGEAGVADPLRAKHLQEERRYARNLCRGFAEIDALLINDQNHITKAKWLAESLRAMARPSLAPQLQERIQVICQNADAYLNSPDL